MKRCFVIMEFNVEGEKLYKGYFKPILLDIGYIAKRSDEFYGNRAFLEDIIEGMRDADIILADVTGENKNVNYELGRAHEMKKEVVIIITQDINSVASDYRHYRIIEYKPGISGWEIKFEKDLRKTIEAINKQKEELQAS